MNAILIHQSELRTYTKVVPFQEKKYLTLCSTFCIVKTTEWNGLILKLIIEVKYIGIILSPDLMDLVVF
jgi:hypothetical protein